MITKRIYGDLNSIRKLQVYMDNDYIGRYEVRKLLYWPLRQVGDYVMTVEFEDSKERKKFEEAYGIKFGHKDFTEIRDFK